MLARTFFKTEKYFLSVRVPFHEHNNSVVQNFHDSPSQVKLINRVLVYVIRICCHLFDHFLLKGKVRAWVENCKDYFVNGWRGAAQ